jgi:hypothetical protein
MMARQSRAIIAFRAQIRSQARAQIGKAGLLPLQLPLDPGVSHKNTDSGGLGETLALEGTLQIATPFALIGKTLHERTTMASPFFIKSKSGDLVIGIQEGSTKPGTLLDGFTGKGGARTGIISFGNLSLRRSKAIRCFGTRRAGW